MNEIIVIYDSIHLSQGSHSFSNNFQLQCGSPSTLTQISTLWLPSSFLKRIQLKCLWALTSINTVQVKYLPLSSVLLSKPVTLHPCLETVISKHRLDYKILLVKLLLCLKYFKNMSHNAKTKLTIYMVIIYCRCTYFNGLLIIWPNLIDLQ